MVGIIEKIEAFLKIYWPYLLVGLVIFAPVFVNLGAFPLRIWDEARLAKSAVEMAENGNYLIPHIDGQPDMWSTKPPFLIWIQVICLKLFGWSDFSVRLPSALSAFSTCMLLVFICRKILSSNVAGIAAALVLVTIPGYMSMHGTRTADYDALLTLLTTLSAFAVFAFFITDKAKYLYLFFLFLSLGVLTKSVAALMFLPGIAIFALIDKKVIVILKSRAFYFGLGGALLLVIGYYFAREQVNPGYWEAVKLNELGGRFAEAIEHHQYPFNHYYNLMLHGHVKPWFLCLPLGVILGLTSRGRHIRKLTLFSTILSLSFFLVISTAQTKCWWYAIPLYPFFALIISIGVYRILQLIGKIRWIDTPLKIKIISTVLFVLVFYFPFVHILKKTVFFDEDEHHQFYSIGAYMKKVLDGEIEMKGDVFVYDGYGVQNNFYVDCLNHEGYSIQTKKMNDISSGDLVYTNQDTIRDYINAHFQFEVIEEFEYVTTYRVITDKE